MMNSAERGSGGGWWISTWLVLIVLVTAWGCGLDREERRELTAPLGPGGEARQRPPALPIGEPPPLQQFSIRSSRIGTGEGTGEADEGPGFHFEALVIDTHVDTPEAMLDHDYDLLERHEFNQLDVPRMREGGLDAAFFSVWVNPREYRGEAAYERALALFEVIHEVAWRSAEVDAIDTVGELDRAVENGHTAMLIGVEGGQALGTADEATALRRLREFRALGARYMTITWSNDNPLGHSSTGDHPERGLTDLGRRVIEEMERIGMVVDVSHVSDQTFWDIMEVATRPVIASHSSSRALSDHPRNMTDEMIRRVAEGGGAVCVNFYTHYIDANYAGVMRRIADEHSDVFDAIDIESVPYPNRGEVLRGAARELYPDLDVPDLGTLADHFVHMVHVAGSDAVCLGSDFDGMSELPLGLDDVSQLPALTEVLRERGLSEGQLLRILGGNVRRILQANEPRPEERAEGGEETGEEATEGEVGTGLGTGGTGDAADVSE